MCDLYKTMTDMIKKFNKYGIEVNDVYAYSC